MCDIVLLIFHLVLSSFTFDGVDVTMAQNILDWNLRRYPNGELSIWPHVLFPKPLSTGVFFLFGGGRLALCRSQPRKAIEFYTKAHVSQSQYRNLHHISFWEIAIANFCLWDIPASLICWRDLQAEATVSHNTVLDHDSDYLQWSKACYSYGMAVCLLELGSKDNVTEAAKLMEEVPRLRQKIAGKSIPVEVSTSDVLRIFLFVDCLSEICGSQSS